MTLVLLTLAALAVLFIRERAHDSRVDRLLASSNAARLEERKEWTRERQVLLNRIKPETAQYLPDDEPVHAPPAVHPDVDGEWWESREELAERMAREEIGS